MKTAILYDSATGNTAYLAQALKQEYPQAVYCTPQDCDIEQAERVFVGFWTDKGTCSERLQAVLPKLAGKEVFLFGTAGFGASQEYFAQIIARVSEKLPDSCRVIGWYMCAGRMGEGVRKRYEAMCQVPETREKGEMLLRNFELAATHPNEQDVAALLEQVRTKVRS